MVPRGVTEVLRVAWEGVAREALGERVAPGREAEGSGEREVEALGVALRAALEESLALGVGVTVARVEEGVAVVVPRRVRGAVGTVAVGER